MEGDTLFRYNMKEMLTIYEMGMKEFMKNVLSVLRCDLRAPGGSNSRKVFKAKT